MGWVVNATPRPLNPRERPGTHCIGGWVGPRARLDGYGKSCPRKTGDKINLRWNDGRFDVIRIWDVKFGDLEKAVVYLKWTVLVFDRKN